MLCWLIVPGLHRNCYLAFMDNSRSQLLLSEFDAVSLLKAFCWNCFISKSPKWMSEILWHFSLFIVKTLLGQRFGIGGLFICTKDDEETCNPTGRPFYLSVDTRLQASVFISAEQPVNDHCKSWNLSYPAPLRSIHLLGTCIAKAGSALPHGKIFPL